MDVDSGSIRVLFVDDDINILTTFSRAVRRFGFQSSIATSVAEAKDLLLAGSFDAIVTDYEMPGGNGITLLEWSREKHPGTIRYLLTGRGTFDVALSAINRGAVDRLLTKPCDVRELALSVRSAVEHRALAERARELAEKLRRRRAASVAANADGALSVVDRDSTGAVVIDVDEDRLIAEVELLLGKFAVPLQARSTEQGDGLAA